MTLTFEPVLESQEGSNKTWRTCSDSSVNGTHFSFRVLPGLYLMYGINLPHPQSVQTLRPAPELSLL